MFQETFTRFNKILVPFFAVLGFSSPCLAQPITLPAGQACPDFGITIDIIPPDNRVEKTFYDKNGNVVRYLDAGKGNELVFTNSTTNFTFRLKAGGAVEQTTLNPDGTQTVVATGQEVLGRVLKPRAKEELQQW
jgi:uncharacterized protein RhaS with RHS repeats